MNFITQLARDIVESCPIRYPQSVTVLKNLTDFFQKEEKQTGFMLALDDENPYQTRSAGITCTASYETEEGLFFKGEKVGGLTGYLNGVPFRSAILFFENRAMYEQLISMSETDKKLLLVNQSVLLVMDLDSNLSSGPAGLNISKKLNNERNQDLSKLVS